MHLIEAGPLLTLRRVELRATLNCRAVMWAFVKLRLKWALKELVWESERARPLMSESTRLMDCVEMAMALKWEHLV